MASYINIGGHEPTRSEDVIILSHSVRWGMPRSTLSLSGSALVGVISGLPQLKFCWSGHSSTGALEHRVLQRLEQIYDHVLHTYDEVWQLCPSSSWRLRRATNSDSLSTCKDYSYNNRLGWSPQSDHSYMKMWYVPFVLSFDAITRYLLTMYYIPHNTMAHFMQNNFSLKRKRFDSSEYVS